MDAKRIIDEIDNRVAAAKADDRGTYGARATVIDTLLGLREWVVADVLAEYDGLDVWACSGCGRRHTGVIETCVCGGRRPRQCEICERQFGGSVVEAENPRDGVCLDCWEEKAKMDAEEDGGWSAAQGGGPVVESALDAGERVVVGIVWPEAEADQGERIAAALEAARRLQPDGTVRYDLGRAVLDVLPDEEV